MATIHGRFTVQSRLRATFLGNIWLCHDLQDNNRPVAVKQVHLDLYRQAIAQNLVLDNPWNETHTLNTLQTLGIHENVVQIHQHFEQGDSWFVVMEFCKSGDLRQTLQRQPQHRFPEAQALLLFAQIVSGVRLLHNNGIAHRDLSLENVLLSGNGDDGGVGTLKICDFGLSTKTDHLCLDCVGKAYYMAPEVVNGDEYDPRPADLWSLGIILFVLLTGSPLTSIASKTEKEFVVLKKLGINAIFNAWQMGDLVTAETIDLMTGMLQIEPSNRFTIEDVALHPAINLP